MLTAPATLEDLTRRIADRAGLMPKRLRQCADFIARNPDRVAVSTVAELASAADVQPSAVMRFAQDLGFSGYTQMQRLYRDEYSRKWPDYATRLQNLRQSGAENPGAMLAEFVEAGRSSLERLMSTVDLGEVARAVDLLAAAPMIHLVGYRRAFPVASYLAYALEKMAVPCILHSATGALATGHALRAGDAVLAVSFAPYSPETVAFADDAHGSGNPVVVVTDSAASPLMRLEPTAILVSEVDVGAFRALSATFAIAITLAVAVGTRREAGR